MPNLINVQKLIDVINYLVEQEQKSPEDLICIDVINCELTQANLPELESYNDYLELKALFGIISYDELAELKELYKVDQ